MSNRVIEVSFIQKLKIWLCACCVAVTICSKNFLFSLWKRPVETRYPDKPLACLVDNTIAYHSYIKVNGVKLHYVEGGDKYNPLVLLLHGFPDCWIGWRLQIKPLEKHFRVVAVDLKGFGDSEKPQWRSQYHVTVLIRELRQLLLALQGPISCYVIGHDLGALLAWYLAALHPELVDKLVVISCPHPNVHWEDLPSPQSRFIRFCQLPRLPEAEIRKNNLSLIDEVYTHLTKRNETAVTNAYKYVFSRAQDLTGPLNYLRNLPFTRLFSGKVVVPTLLIVGNKDPYVTVESIVKSTGYLKDFQLNMVEDVGHFPHQEQPDYVNSLLTSYLLGEPVEECENNLDPQRGLISSLVSNTFKYGNSFVDNFKKTTNVLVRKPHLLKSTG